MFETWSRQHDDEHGDELGDEVGDIPQGEGGDEGRIPEADLATKT
jgi:hypothetical protein